MVSPFTSAPGGQGRTDDLLDHVLAKPIVGDIGGVLGREHDAGNRNRTVAVVGDGDLGLGIGPEVGKLAGFEAPPVGLDQLVRQPDGCRHQLRGLVAGEAEHHSLVAGALLLVQPLALGDALGDVRRLAAQGDVHRTGRRVESHVAVGVADVVDHLAHEGRDLDVRFRRHLARDQDEPGRGQSLAGHARAGVLRQHGVEDRVGDLVAHLVRVTHRDRLGREESGFGHRRLLWRTLRTGHSRGAPNRIQTVRG
jgi:hypothetical protein